MISIFKTPFNFGSLKSQSKKAFKVLLFFACLIAVSNVLKIAMDNKMAMPALSSSLQYVDMFSSGRLPSNLIQAQRDYFGAHTYERNDREGNFHTDWSHS